MWFCHFWGGFVWILGFFRWCKGSFWELVSLWEALSWMLPLLCHNKVRSLFLFLQLNVPPRWDVCFYWQKCLSYILPHGAQIFCQFKMYLISADQLENFGNILKPTLKRLISWAFTGTYLKFVFGGFYFIPLIYFSFEHHLLLIWWVYL